MHYTQSKYSRVQNRRRAGPGKFVKKNKCRAFNKRRAGTKCTKIMLQKNIKLENISRPWKKFQNLINVGPLIRL